MFYANISTPPSIYQTFKLQLACTCIMQANPEMQPYRRRVVPYYNDLCIICVHAVADGRYNLSCFDLDMESEGAYII